MYFYVHVSDKWLHDTKIHIHRFQTHKTLKKNHPTFLNTTLPPPPPTPTHTHTSLSACCLKRTWSGEAEYIYRHINPQWEIVTFCMYKWHLQHFRFLSVSFIASCHLFVGKSYVIYLVYKNCHSQFSVYFQCTFAVYIYSFCKPKWGAYISLLWWFGVLHTHLLCLIVLILYCSQVMWPWSKGGHSETSVRIISSLQVRLQPGLACL